MSDNYAVRLMNRTEVVEYRTADRVYRFDLGKRGRKWILYLPPSPDFAANDAEQALARVSDYLAKRWWFWIFPLTYSVRVEIKNGTWL
jgi:hypothetical protein